MTYIEVLYAGRFKAHVDGNGDWKSDDPRVASQFNDECESIGYSPDWAESCYQKVVDKNPGLIKLLKWVPHEEDPAPNDAKY